MLKKLFDLEHPFFRPLWRRLLIIAVCLGWGTFEFLSGSYFWGMLFGGLGLYCTWGFLINYTPRADNETQ